MAKIKKGDQVIVIAGKEKGKQGTVLSVSNDRVKVEGLNLVKKQLLHESHQAERHLIHGS
jgi:large subunit ribosomal protein L24